MKPLSLCNRVRSATQYSADASLRADQAMLDMAFCIALEKAMVNAQGMTPLAVWDATTRIYERAENALMSASKELDKRCRGR